MQKSKPVFFLRGCILQCRWPEPLKQRCLTEELLIERWLPPAEAEAWCERQRFLEWKACFSLDTISLLSASFVPCCFPETGLTGHFTQNRRIEARPASPWSALLMLKSIKVSWWRMAVSGNGPRTSVPAYGNGGCSLERDRWLVLA